MYCSSTEVLVTRNRELLFPCKEKPSLPESWEMQEYSKGDGWALQSREDVATALLTPCAAVKGEIWPLPASRCVRSWTDRRHGSVLKSPGPDASCGTREQRWEGETCPVLPLLSVLCWITCWRWPRFSPDGHFPFPFCKNFSMVFLSKWEGEWRRRDHVWYLSRYIPTCFRGAGAMKWLCIPRGRTSGGKLSVPAACPRQPHAAPAVWPGQGLLGFSFWSLPYTRLHLHRGHGCEKQLFSTHTAGLSSQYRVKKANGDNGFSFLSNPDLLCDFNVGLGFSQRAIGISSFTLDHIPHDLKPSYLIP